jgi:hypothetical protein
MHGAWLFFNHTDLGQCIILFKMAITFKLPVINADSALLLNTPVAATDVVLASGRLTIKDESGANALIIKATDLLGFRYTAGVTGTANVVDVQLSGVPMSFPAPGNGLFTLTVSAPYAQAFFSGGVETNATFQARTYTVGTDPTPTAAELATLFVSEINADINAYFTAVVTGSTTVRITAKNAGFGGLNVVATVTDSTAWVAPAGTPSQVLAQINNAGLVSAALYQTYQIIYRKEIRTNLVNGMEVSKPVTALVYLNAADAGAAATVTKLTSILNGSWAATSTQYVDYLGCPAV